MKILVVANNRHSLEEIEKDILNAIPRDAIVSCYTADEAVKESQKNVFDVAFLGINMDSVSGLEVAKDLKKNNPRINIIFVTSHYEYAVDAFNINASGYILKPITADKIKANMDNLRYQVSDKEPMVKIKCFGNFEIFVDGKPMHFKSQKTKELLAYLVNRRGALCSKGEIIATLWEDDDHVSYYKKLRSDLIDTFKEYGIDNLLVVRRGMLGVRLSELYCDYEDWLANGKKSKNQYDGEYMTQYSWAETTNAEL